MRFFVFVFVFMTNWMVTKQRNKVTKVYSHESSVRLVDLPPLNCCLKKSSFITSHHTESMADFSPKFSLESLLLEKSGFC